MRLSLLLLPGLLLAGTAAGQTERRASDALRAMFGDSIEVRSSTLAVSAEERTTIRARTKAQWPGDSVRVLVCRSRGRTIGYGFLDDVKGKMNFITYLVGLTPAGTVRDVDVLVYRESYGGEIAYESFRRQFRDKSAADPLLPGRDVKNISGATISVHAITGGIRRILATYELLRSRIE